MSSIPEQLTQFTQASNDTARRCASISLDCATQMMNLQTDAALEAMKVNAVNLKEILNKGTTVNSNGGAADIAGSLSAWSNLYVQNMTRTVDVSRAMADIVVKAQSEFAKAIDISRSAPGGSPAKK